MKQMQAARDGRPPPKKVENLKKKMEEAAPPSVADAEEPVEPGETTETFKPEARATSELVQPCFKQAAPEEMALVYLTSLEQDDNETREQMLTRTSLGAEELFGAAIKSPPTVVRAAEKEGPKVLRRTKKSGANGVMSAFGRHDMLMMARRMEAVQTEAQHAVSTATREVEALDLVEGQWFQVLPEVGALNAKVEKLRVSVTDELAGMRVSVADELADMRRTNADFHETIEAELAQAAQHAQETQESAQHVQEAFAEFQIALARFRAQQTRWFQCALRVRTESEPAALMESVARERSRADHCWYAVEAALAGMGDHYLEFLPFMRQMVAQVEAAVAPEDAPLERIGPSTAGGIHTPVSRAEGEGAEQCDEGSRSREGAGWEHATWSRRCRWPARAERRLLRRRRWKRLMRALRGKG